MAVTLPTRCSGLRTVERTAIATRVRRLDHGGAGGIAVGDRHCRDAGAFWQLGPFLALTRWFDGGGTGIGLSLVGSSHSSVAPVGEALAPELECHADGGIGLGQLVGMDSGSEVHFSMKYISP